MKTSLKELLNRITPLPWKYNLGNVTSGEKKAVFSNPRGGALYWVNQGQDSIRYAAHAANALPELVEASDAYLHSTLVNGGASQELIDRFQSAIAKASEIEVFE